MLFFIPSPLLLACACKMLNLGTESQQGSTVGERETMLAHIWCEFILWRSGYFAQLYCSAKIPLVKLSACAEGEGGAVVIFQAEAVRAPELTCQEIAEYSRAPGVSYNRKRNQCN